MGVWLPAQNNIIIKVRDAIQRGGVRRRFRGWSIASQRMNVPDQAAKSEDMIKVTMRKQDAPVKCLKPTPLAKSDAACLHRNQSENDIRCA